MDIFSWLPAKELSLEELEQIVIDDSLGIVHAEYIVRHEEPNHKDHNIASCKTELLAEGKKIAYILKHGKVVAMVGYKTKERNYKEG